MPQAATRASIGVPWSIILMVLDQGEDAQRSNRARTPGSAGPRRSVRGDAGDYQHTWVTDTLGELITVAHAGIDRIRRIPRLAYGCSRLGRASRRGSGRVARGCRARWGRRGSAQPPEPVRTSGPVPRSRCRRAKSPMVAAPAGPSTSRTSNRCPVARPTLAVGRRVRHLAMTAGSVLASRTLRHQLAARMLGRRATRPVPTGAAPAHETAGRDGRPLGTGARSGRTGIPRAASSAAASSSCGGSAIRAHRPDAWRSGAGVGCGVRGRGPPVEQEGCDKLK